MVKYKASNTLVSSYSSISYTTLTSTVVEGTGMLSIL